MSSKQDVPTRRFTSPSLDFIPGRKNLEFGRVLCAVSFIASAVLLAFAISVRKLNLEDFNEAEGGDGVFASLIVDSNMILVGSIVGLVASVLGVLGSQMNSKPLVLAFCLLATGASVLAIIAAAGMSSILSDFESTLCLSAECNPRDGLDAATPFSSRMLEIVDLQLALFDNCCLAQHKNWGDISEASEPATVDFNLYNFRIQQEMFGPCPADPNVDVSSVCQGTTKIPGIVSEALASISPKLCTCIPNPQDSYNAISSRINAADTCAKLKNVYVYLESNEKIPSEQISLFSAIATQANSAYFSSYPQEIEEGFLKVPLIGNPGPAWDKTIESMENGGFGCGIGITKGFMYYIVLYLQQNLAVLTIIAYTSSIANIFMVVLFTIFLCMAKDGGLDDIFETDLVVDKNLNTKVKPQLSFEKVEAKLNAFYQQHDPSKLVSNGNIHPDVVEFALDRGIDVLNAKLRLKYKADLLHPNGMPKTIRESFRMKRSENKNLANVDDII